MRAIKLSLCLILLLLYLPVQANSLVEEPLKQGITSVVSLNSKAGIGKINDLTEKYPNFKLAHYIKADLLSYRSGQHFKNNKNSFISEDVYKELEARLKDDSVIKEALYPSEVVYLGQKYAHVVVADISKSRLYVFNNNLDLVNSFYISIGKGGAGKEKLNDGKTPIGTYFIDKRIDGGILPDKYGDAAYALNYPNAWDKMNGKTGYGIWLHGTAKELYNRAPKATEGCIALANDDLKILDQYITENTPVIIGNPVKWSRKKAVYDETELVKVFNVLKKEMQQTVTETITATESQANFFPVANANASVQNIDIQMNNLSLIHGPDNEMLIATLLQQFNDKVMRIEQYWKNTERGWEVVSQSKI